MVLCKTLATLQSRPTHGRLGQVKQASGPGGCENAQIDQLCAERPSRGGFVAGASLGGSVRVLRGFRGHSACCRPPTLGPVDPALTVSAAAR
jgi:hypothetical protein